MTGPSTDPWWCNTNRHPACRRRAIGSFKCQVISLAAAVLLSVCLASLQVLAASQGGNKGKTPAGNPKDGKKLYISNTCDVCHGVLGEGNDTGTRIAPNPIPFPQFLTQLRHPSGVMLPYDDQTITDVEAGDIYAFLKTLKETPKAKVVAPGIP